MASRRSILPSGLGQLVEQLLAANQEAGHAGRFLTLGTQASDGPRCRTMVFRGFDPDTHALRLYTDARSDKIGELAGCDRVEVCWYFATTWEQLRITGRCQVVSSNVEHLFRSLSDETRRSFGRDWPPPLPGDDRDDDSDARDQTGLSNFRVLLIHAERAVHLRLKQGTCEEVDVK